MSSVVPITSGVKSTINGITLLALIASIGFNYNQQGIINSYRLQEKLYEAEGRILKDEVHVLDQLLTNEKAGPTYEEGLADGLQRSTSIGYVDGYHAAISQNADYQNHMNSLTESKSETDAASNSAAPAVSDN